MKKLFFNKDQLICRAGDIDTSLYQVFKGRVLICTNKDTQIIPLAYLERGDFIGEFSYFDESPRSAHVIALSECELIVVENSYKHELPHWFVHCCINVVKKVKNLNEALSKKGAKRKTAEIKPLSIEDQRKLYQIITE
jgi:CRP/FNR family cyclic AMP-dependent transcriptional regulator